MARQPLEPLAFEPALDDRGDPRAPVRGRGKRAVEVDAAGQLQRRAHAGAPCGGLPLFEECFGFAGDVAHVRSRG